MRIKVEVSARHIHLSQKDLDILYGPGYALKKVKSLSQKPDFAAQEEVTANCGGKTLKMRVVGPTRRESQAEISATDAIKLGLSAPARLSGDLKGAPFLQIIGPKGIAECRTIIAKRHAHCSAPEAKKLRLKNNQAVKVKIVGERGLVFENILIRIDGGYSLALHIDTDEANACGLKSVCGYGELIIGKE